MSRGPSNGFSFNEVPVGGAEMPNEAGHASIEVWAPGSTSTVGNSVLASSYKSNQSVEPTSLSFTPLFDADIAQNGRGQTMQELITRQIDRLPVSRFISEGLVSVDQSASVQDMQQSLRRIDQMGADKKVGAINVVDASQKDKADFLIKQDGSVEFLPNASKQPGDKTSIVVAVEKPSKDTAADQKEAIDWFVGEYLAHHFMNTRPDGTVAGAINDNNMLSPDVKQQLTEPVMTTVPQPALDNAQQATRQFAPNTDGTPSQGTMSADDSDKLFSKRVVSIHEDPNASPVLDAIASIFSRGQENPDDYVTVGRDGKTPVLGTYGLTAIKINNWLDDLGFPSDWPDADDGQMQNFVQALMAQHKITKEFGQKLMHKDFRQHLSAFLKAVSKGHKPTAAEMKEYLPGKLQTKIARALVEKYDATTGGHHDAGKIATMWVLDGKKPTNEKAYHDLEQGADNIASLSQARGKHGHGKAVHWTSESTVNSDGSNGLSKLNCKLVDNAESVVSGTRSDGHHCERGVEQAIRKTGYDMPNQSDAYKFIDYARQHPEKFTEISAQQAKQTPGAIMVADRNQAGGKYSGHIFINKGDGTQLSDVQRNHLLTPELARRNGYGKVAAFVLNPDYKNNQA